MQVGAKHPSVVASIAPCANRQAGEDRGVHRRIRIARFAEEHLHAEVCGEIADAIHLANLLECDDIRVDAAEHVADQVATTFAAEQDVVGGDANPAG